MLFEHIVAFSESVIKCIKWLGDVFTKPFTYKNKIDKYIVPYFGRANIKDIKQIDVQAFFNKHSNLLKSMQDKFKIILHSIFESAIDNDLCYKNPVKNIKITDGVKMNKNTYTKSEVYEIVQKCIELKYTDILLLIKTGIRRSELLGLKWSDINLKHQYIRIERAVTPNAGSPVIDLPKSDKSIREIPIDDELTEYLTNNFASGYVTTNSEKFITPSGYDKHYKTKMIPIITELNMKYLSPHELRHTYGTLLRENGADIYTIQKVMGHSDINITAQIYVHNDINVLRKNMKI